MGAHSGEGDPWIPTHGDHLIRSMSSVRWSLDAARQQPQGAIEPSSDEDDFDDVGEDQDSDGDFASGDSDNTWLDVSVVTFITLTSDAIISCENRFPPRGIMAPARLAAGTRWTAGTGRPVLAQVNS
jgi:hypothetical protein